LPLFRRRGWTVLKVFPTKLFYTPFLTRHSLPGLRLAHWLSYALGSSCLVYIMRAGKEDR
jgi:hypothetical protein